MVNTCKIRSKQKKERKKNEQKKMNPTTVRAKRMRNELIVVVCSLHIDMFDHIAAGLW